MFPSTVVAKMSFLFHRTYTSYLSEEAVERLDVWGRMLLSGELNLVQQDDVQLVSE